MGRLTQYNDLYCVKTGIILNRPKKVKLYDDVFVSLYKFKGESRSTLGYALQVKRDFAQTYATGLYVSLMGEVETHTQPDLIYDDPRLYLYKFNSRKRPAYWCLVRHRV